MKKRILSLLIAVMMFVGVFPTNVFAKELTESPTAWDGTTIDTSWYNTTDTSFTLSNGSQLQGFAQIVSGTAGTIPADSFSGKTVTLANDIDLNSKNFTCIGLYSSAPFAGTFNGDGHQLSNLSITATASYTGALFSNNKGKILNLTIASGSISSSYSNTASLVSYNEGKIINCLNRAAVSSTSSSVGGIAARSIGSYAYIVNSANHGSVTSAGTSASLILGGITGMNSSDSKVINCYNTGNVTSTNNKTRVGGIAGTFIGGKITNSYNCGNVVSTGASTGAVIGYTTDAALADGSVTLTNCYFLKNDAVNNGLNAAGAVTLTESRAKAVGTTELSGLASVLGNDFAADTNTINNGYPVLTWQNTGILTDPTYESLEGLSVTAVTALSNGQVSVSLDRTLTYTNLSLSDFSADIAVDTGAPAVLTLNTLVQNGNTVTFTFTPLSQTTRDQSITVSVGYKNSQKHSLSFTLAASGDWLLYTEKPTGDGSAESPYQIGSASQLAWFCALVNGRLTDGTVANTSACAQLTADITLNSTLAWSSWDQNTQSLRYWTPIGTDNVAYNGTFDGQGHIIKGLYINNTTRYMIGLFGYCTSTSVIKNIGLESSYIYSNSTSSTCYIGGICGHSLGILSNCYSSATIYAKPAGSNVSVGGICGWLDWSTSTNCGLITGCFNLGKVQAYGTSTTYNSYSGGICGLCQGKITCSYNLGSVSGLDTGERIGGICGYFMDMSGIGTLSNCYSAGAVTGTVNAKNIGSITGYSTKSCTNCYYLDSLAADTNGTAKSAAAFTDGTVTGLLGNAFTTKSFINGGYPCLKWQSDSSWGQEERVAAPVITVEGGELADTVTFKVTCATQGATVHYTTDGSAPSASSDVYTGAGIPLSSGTFRAIAIQSGLQNSVISSETVSPTADPVITPGTCVISSETPITISCVTPNSTVYYTTDGSNPLGSSGTALSSSAVRYTGAFTVNKDTTVKAIAYSAGKLKSSVSSETYTASWLIYTQKPTQDVDGNYLIGQAEELAWFARLVNGGLSGVAQNANANAKLTGSISLDGHVWIPIGTSGSKYGGTFDGNNFTIGGLTFDSTESNVALFRYNNGSVKNLCITGNLYTMQTGIGSVCAQNAGIISNCFNKAHIISGNGLIGGICASNNTGGTIQYCRNSGSIKRITGNIYGTVTNVGGIVGLTSGLVSDCYNTGIITSMIGTGTYWGGIAGNLTSSGAIDRCYSLSIMTEGCHRTVSHYGEIGGWGGESGLLAGGGDTGAGTITNSYCLENVTLTGEKLKSVELTDQFRAYPSQINNGSQITKGLAGYEVWAADWSKIDLEGTYYAFYDATNNQIIALKLEGEGDGSNVVVDAKNLGDVSFSGTGGSNLTIVKKTIHVVTVPANTSSVKFINTDELQDYTFFLTENRAAAFSSDNKASVLKQVNQTWPAAYEVIAAALENVGESEGPVSGKVQVIVENTTFTQRVDGISPAWTGTLVDTWVDLDQDTTMMSAIVTALTSAGYTQEGAGNNYITSINGLKAFDGGGGSGWMGTLNDWFTNAGFTEFTVQNGSLEPGDVIRILYTQNLGDDLGGTWDNNEKTIKQIAFSSGVLSPVFNKDTHSYTITVPQGTTDILVTPTATNKNFQVRTSKGTTEYKRTASIPVDNGTVITVKCGDPDWPSMNNQAGGIADSVPAETYTITVVYGDYDLTAVKNAAKSELDTYKNMADYRDAQKTELASAIAAGKASIDAAADTAGIDLAVNNAKAAMDAIKTNAQFTAEELTAFKETAKASLDTYKNPANYREAQKAELADAISAGKGAIDGGQNEAAVSAALQQAKAAIDQIKTDVQLTEEEHPTKSVWQMILEFIQRVYNFFKSLFHGTL